MITINRDKGCCRPTPEDPKGWGYKPEHAWVTLGSHSLHAGHKGFGELPYPDLRLPIRETRVVRRCVCGALDVTIRRHFVYGLAGKRTKNAQP